MPKICEAKMEGFNTAFGYNVLIAQVAVTCENLRQSLLLLMGHKSFGICKKNVSSHPAECATYLEDSFFTDISLIVPSFRYLQLQKVVARHSANFN
jgi:hypothetical protein